MKRGIFLIALLLLAIMPLASADIVLNKQEFDSGETFFAEISENFVTQPSLDNIVFYRGHVEIPMEFEIEKVNNAFYLYALLIEKQEGNYSLSIEGTEYYRGTQVVDEPITINFTITNETADFSLKPGFIFTENSFVIEVQNLAPSTITLSLNPSSGLNLEETDFSLLSGQTKQVPVTLNSPSPEEAIVFSTDNTEYNFKAFISDSVAVPSQQISESLEFEVDSIEVSMATGSEGKRVIYLKNIGQSDLEDIDLKVSPLLEDYVALNPKKISEIDSQESVKIELSITSDLEEAVLEGFIVAKTVNSSVYTQSKIILNFISDFVPSNQSESSSGSASVKSCSEVGGEICSDNTACGEDTETFKARDGVCCLGICQEVPSGFGFGKVIGWGLLILILLFVFWFYRAKYRRARPSQGFDRFLKR